jgi:hypothetical protein
MDGKASTVLKGNIMYELRRAKSSNPLVPIYVTLAILIGIPIAYAALLLIAAFLKGFLGW